MIKNGGIVSVLGLICGYLPRLAFGAEVVEQGGNYVATGDGYSAQIDAATGRLSIKNAEGHDYTSFDIFVNLPYQAYTPAYKNWAISDTTLTGEVWDGDAQKYQTVELVFNDVSFEVNFKAVMSGNASGHNTATLFKKPSGSGIDLGPVRQTFSPQIVASGTQPLGKDIPKAFANSTGLPIPDGKPAFYLVPGPMQFSLKSTVGWFSMSFTELLDASKVILEPDGESASVSMDLPWSNLQAAYGADSEYEIGVVFQFPQDEWDAVAKYTEYLYLNDYAEPALRAEFQDRPDWWSWPIGCTWGDQVRNDTSNQGGPNADEVLTRAFAESWADTLSQNLGTTDLIVIIDAGWEEPGHHPTRLSPSGFSGEADMRAMVDGMHAKGYKVLLWQFYPAWQELSEAEMQANMEKLLGSGQGQYDADGFKFDFVYQATTPEVQSVDAELGFGFKRIHALYDRLLKTAKAVKPDALVTFSTADPHYSDVVDWVRLNDNSVYGSSRQIVSALTLPSAAIDGDGWYMDQNPNTWKTFYLRSAANGNPSFYYNQAWGWQGDTPTAPQPHEWGLLANLSRMSRLAPPADVEPTDIASKDMRRFRSDLGTVAQSLGGGQTLVVWPNGESGKVLSLKGDAVSIPVDPRRAVTAVTIEGGEAVPFNFADGSLSFTPQPEVVYDVTTSFSGEERHDLGCNRLVCTPGWDDPLHEQQGGAGGAGAGGADASGGTGVGSGASGGAAGNGGEDDGSCGCSLPGYSRPIGGALMAGLFAVTALGFRRRRKHK